jgi:hypothetical protein
MLFPSLLRVPSGEVPQSTAANIRRTRIAPESSDRAGKVNVPPQNDSAS